MTRIIPLERIVYSSQNLFEISRQILAGKLVVYPTDTIYGLGCLPGARTTIEKIKGLKGRTELHPFSLLYPDVDLLLAHFQTQKEVCELLTALLPGPVTLVVPLPENYPYHHLASSDNYIGIRLIDFPPLNPILKMLDQPLITTSVNPHGASPARTVKEVLEYFPHSIDLILQWERHENNQPSTVVKFTGTTLKILRKGKYPLERLHFIFKRYTLEI